MKLKRKIKDAKKLKNPKKYSKKTKIYLIHLLKLTIKMKKVHPSLYPPNKK